MTFLRFLSRFYGFYKSLEIERAGLQRRDHQLTDVLITLTAGKPAQPIEDDPPTTSKEATARLDFLLTRPFNLANTPARSVSCGFCTDHLPIGRPVSSCRVVDGDQPLSRYGDDVRAA